MKWYQMAGGIFAGIAAFAICGCGGSTKNVAQTNKSLTLCVSDIVNETYKDAFEAFQKAYPEVELHVESYSELVAGQQRINTQILAGEGPDLLLMSNYGTADVYKMMKAQAFAPLDEFMEADKEWNADDYAQAVLDAGVFEGNQMAMPLSYTVVSALTTQENLKSAGISLDSCQDMSSFLQETAKFYSLDSAKQVNGDVGQLSLFPAFLSGSFLDYSKGELGLDAQTLERACSAYKYFYHDETASGSSLPDTGFCGVGEAIGMGDTCMLVTFSSSAFMEAAQAAAAQATPVLWPYRNGDGQICANIMDYAGIRANSENKQNAWNMLKILMSEAAQSQIAKFRFACPVFKSILEEELDRTKEEAYENGKKLVEMKPLPQDLSAQYKDALMHPQKALFVTDVCISKFIDYMKPFYEDEGSYEDCIGEFQKFIKVYLTE
ncbi:MAG: ABC transporter substrate-binding protein [Eubacterium sp.]|nr:ABC transporter substrate-binding protein [Eubacterium sp.]